MTADEEGAAGAHPFTERIVSSRVLHRGRYLTFRVDTVERPDGSRAERDICGHPGAVTIIAIDDDDQVLLVRQFRVATGDVLLEIPAGGLEIDQETEAVEEPEHAARRELLEETGHEAASWRLLASFWTAPGFATELMHLFLARDLRAIRDGLGEDDDERLELVRMPLAEALALADAGVIRDAKSLVALYRLARLREAGQA